MSKYDFKAMDEQRCREEHRAPIPCRNAWHRKHFLWILGEAIERYG